MIYTDAGKYVDADNLFYEAEIALPYYPAGSFSDRPPPIVPPGLLCRQMKTIITSRTIHTNPAKKNGFPHMETSFIKFHTMLIIIPRF